MDSDNVINSMIISITTEEEIENNFKYVAEGRKHIVCKYIHNNDDNSNSMTNSKCKYLLRLRKLDHVHNNINDNDNNNDEIKKRMLTNISYTDSIIRNWFGINNINNINNNNNRVISMKSTFISLLMSSIANDRPINRKKMDSNIFNYGSIEIDYNYLFKPINIDTTTTSTITTTTITNNNNNNITIELKVKCGLKCNSPFLPYDVNNNKNDNHDIKLHYSRYDLMQLVKFSKYIKNGSGEP